MLDYRKTRNFDSGEVRQAWTAKDTMLYGLGVGLAEDPLDAAGLRFVYERQLVALPTMAAVMASPGFWMRDRADLGIDAAKLVHGEQALTVHGPLPVEGSFVGRTRVTRIVDKGPGKGAVIHAEKQLTDAATGALLAAVESVYFCRGDGGFSAVDGKSDEPARTAAAVLPEGTPDEVFDVATRPEQALVYRLSGDMNPLHADPAVASRLGLQRPILHGLATWGIAGRAVVVRFLAHDPSRLRGLRTRFSAPVYPGETLRFECWKDADGNVAFQVRVPARDALVLSHGYAAVAPA